jgi:hypothetical protein
MISARKADPPAPVLSHLRQRKSAGDYDAPVILAAALARGNFAVLGECVA